MKTVGYYVLSALIILVAAVGLVLARQDTPLAPGLLVGVAIGLAYLQGRNEGRRAPRDI